jgi:predicted Zn-ribbon and HTH transcriptional regulator
MKIIYSKNGKCKSCDYEWNSLGKKPKVCPKCKSYYWETKSRKGVD